MRRGCSPEEAQSALWNLTEASGQGRDVGLEPRKLSASIFQVLGPPYHGVQTGERRELVLLLHSAVGSGFQISTSVQAGWGPRGLAAGMAGCLVGIGDIQ